uniref:NADH-ubiquinone oxidoreductase chain 5 n=1 Tax=Micromelo undatus TaxID=340426 RepID=E6Y182_MICUD|nr:NADH dehydrogenase subunit 5 [Micromelo undatus]ABK92255.1 NADH dehydrogenase subunit 5 [Micromelo undatus]
MTFPVLLLSWMLVLSSIFYLFVNMDSSILLEVDLVLLSSTSFSFMFIFDKISVSFSGVVTLISGMVFLFAHKYMEEDPFSERFFWILVSFVISMNLLIFSGSLFFLLLGWDGLGITSFALIVYYQSSESLSAGFQTLMANRVGDSLIVLSMFLFCLNGQFSFLSLSDKICTSGLMLILTLAALTKSAQFPFSSWLPAAMAAPTPVSALVHSSTLVTAGIYMVIRLSFNIPLDSMSHSILLFCGAITCLLGGWAATYENDIKKIIALSTLSQLGVMVFSLGLGLPYLSLFHLYTHALFKALLFLGAGHILLTSFGSQDIRLLGGIGMSMPLTCVMFNISSLCLVGAPFMSAFYSKHLILEMMLMSSLNLFNVLVMFLATFMTAKYVMRTLKSICWSKTISPLVSASSSFYTTFPVVVLGLGGIMSGKLLSSIDSFLLEAPILPSTHSSFINLITISGLILGLLASGKISSFSLSSLFYLTPLMVKSPKFIWPITSKLSALDYGWLEPSFLFSNSPMYLGMKVSNWGEWPSSRVILGGIFLTSLF